MIQSGRKTILNYLLCYSTINNRLLYVVLRIIFSIIGNHFRIIGRI